MFSSEFRTIRQIKIGDKRGALKKHKFAPWFRFGKRNFRAENEKEAIEKLKERKKNAD